MTTEPSFADRDPAAFARAVKELNWGRVYAQISRGTPSTRASGRSWPRISRTWAIGRDETLAEGVVTRVHRDAWGSGALGGEVIEESVRVVGTGAVVTWLRHRS